MQCVDSVGEHNLLKYMFSVIFALGVPTPPPAAPLLVWAKPA
jgi:hypothetical protein